MGTEARKRAPALTYPTIRSAASKVEGQHVRDRIGAQHRHQQAIHAQRDAGAARRSEEHTSELQSLMRISYAVFCLKKKNKYTLNHTARKSPRKHYKIKLQKDLHTPIFT